MHQSAAKLALNQDSIFSQQTPRNKPSYSEKWVLYDTCARLRCGRVILCLRVSDCRSSPQRVEDFGSLIRWNGKETNWKPKFRPNKSREREVLQLVIAGKLNKQIAGRTRR